MNALVLKADQDLLEYRFFTDSESSAVLSGSIRGFRTGHTVEETLNAVFAEVTAYGNRVEAVALHVEFGGEFFTGPTLATPETIRHLEALVPAAPLHIPPVLAMIRSCAQKLPDCPVTLFFETAFFVNLPERERVYAIDPDLRRDRGLRRYGYHGLFHEAACRSAGPGVRIVSICLESHPEIAAVVDGAPVMVSGGLTPLEGLPGRTSCGEIDSGLLLSLSRREHWGPEQINTLLTQKSGLLGLTGRSVSLAEVMLSGRDEFRLARRLMRYRILQQTGMALAAMNGFDRIIFSGRYSAAGRELGPMLAARLPASGYSGEPSWDCFGTPLMKIMADQIQMAEQLDNQQNQRRKE